jgi:hypothetical protein
MFDDEVTVNICRQVHASVPEKNYYFNDFSALFG